MSKCESRVVQPRSTSSSTLSCQQRSSTSTNTTPSSYICLELLATYTTSISRHSGCSVSIISILFPHLFSNKVQIHVYLEARPQSIQKFPVFLLVYIQYWFLVCGQLLYLGIYIVLSIEELKSRLIDIFKQFEEHFHFSSLCCSCCLKKNKIEPAFCASLVDRVSTVDSSFLSSMLPWDQRGLEPTSRVYWSSSSRSFWWCWRCRRLCTWWRSPPTAGTFRSRTPIDCFTFALS